jgi:hypothetical protein
VAAATAAEPQLPAIEGGVLFGALVIGARDAPMVELVPTLLNSTGSDEIARGFANGMTFVGAGVAAPDRIEGSPPPEREPVGAGACFAERGGGKRRASTTVTSPTSWLRGTFGITRKLVTGSCAMYGRDFRVLIGRADAVQKNRHHDRDVAV